MLRVEKLQFRRAGVVLFEDLDFVVHPGQRVAVAGRNGVGKSTLFQLILGHLQADHGEITFPAHWRVGWMKQEVTPTEREALEYVIDGDTALRETEQALAQTEDPDRLAELHSRYQDLQGYDAHARAGEILYGLGFGSDDLHRPFSEFSGGWRIRLNLAQALMAPTDLLLLDEPTNHLDLETIMWLEGWLNQFDGTVLMIAHDRAFLDACAPNTLYLANARGKLYHVNYSGCERQRAETLAHEQASAAKREAQAAHIQKFIDRFRAKASKARQVQSRIKALERLQYTTSVQIESPYQIEFQQPEKTSNPLFSFHHVALGYGGRAVLRDISQTVLPGARIGVLGANGAGKTTLLRAIVGDLQPLQGEFLRGQHSRVGYFAQHQLERLDSRASALQTLMHEQPDWREQQCRDYLGGWGFSGEMIKRPISTLSGGEKARLVLAFIAMHKPAVLVLDEPTNHLDLDMRDALAFALQDYAGALIIVSHDRATLDKTVDDFWHIDNGALGEFSGDVTDYARLQRETLRSSNPSSSSKKLKRQQRAQRRAEEKNLRDQASDLEKKVERTSSQLAAIEERLADKTTYDSLPADELDELLKRAGQLRQEVERQEEAWLAVLETLEERQLTLSE